METPTDRQVRDALKATDSIKAAAVLLGVSRVTVYRLMAKYGIAVQRVVS